MVSPKDILEKNHQHFLERHDNNKGEGSQVRKHADIRLLSGLDVEEPIWVPDVRVLAPHLGKPDMAQLMLNRQTHRANGCTYRW